MTEAPTAPKKRRYAQRLPLPERRQHLLDAALRVLAREGYGRLSIEAIAREADVTRPVVYGAYDGLGPLLHALLDRCERRALASIADLLPKDGVPKDLVEWMTEAADGFISAVQNDRETWHPILGFIANSPAVVQDRIAEKRELVRTQMAVALAELLGPERSREIDPEVVSHLVLASWEEFGRLALDDRYDRDRLVGTWRGLLVAFTT